MKILINGQPPISDGPGITFDTALIHVHTRWKRVGRKSVETHHMFELLHRVVSKVSGPVRSCIEPNQEYIDLHWHWDGFIRIGSPKVGFIGQEVHVAVALWSLWQNFPTVAAGPCRRLCMAKGCVNPHHYEYQGKDMVQPARMTFSLDGDPGEVAAKRRDDRTIAAIESRDGTSPDDSVELSESQHLQIWKDLDEATKAMMRAQDPEWAARMESLLGK